MTFADGLLLSKALSRSTVDLLILDWNSSGLCGLDLLKSVRASFGERVPVDGSVEESWTDDDPPAPSEVLVIVRGPDERETHHTRYLPALPKANRDPSPHGVAMPPTTSVELPIVACKANALAYGVLSTTVSAGPPARGRRRSARTPRGSPGSRR